MFYFAVDGKSKRQLGAVQYVGHWQAMMLTFSVSLLHQFMQTIAGRRAAIWMEYPLKLRIKPGCRRSQYMLGITSAMLYPVLALMEVGVVVMVVAQVV